MNLEHISCTHIGARDINQDFVCEHVENSWAMFLVADGLGGHERGEVASKVFCESLISLAPEASLSIQHDPVEGMVKLIKETTHLFRTHLHDHYQLIDAQTTFALAFLDDNHLITAHIGDTRIYRINKKEILWRTPDHSEVQALFDKGKITEDEMTTHPDQNTLLKTVNIFDEPEPEIYIHPPLEKDEGLILCSDGFWGNLTAKKIADCIRLNSIETKLPQLVEKIAKDNPEDCDNITAMVVRHQ